MELVLQVEDLVEQQEAIVGGETVELLEEPAISACHRAFTSVAAIPARAASRSGVSKYPISRPSPRRNSE